MRDWFLESLYTSFTLLGGRAEKTSPASKRRGELLTDHNLIVRCNLHGIHGRRKERLVGIRRMDECQQTAKCHATLQNQPLYLLTLGGNMTLKPFGLSSGKSSLDVAISSISWRSFHRPHNLVSENFRLLDVSVSSAVFLVTVTFTCWPCCRTSELSHFWLAATELKILVFSMKY